MQDLYIVHFQSRKSVLDHADDMTPTWQRELND